MNKIQKEIFDYKIRMTKTEDLLTIYACLGVLKIPIGIIQSIHALKEVIITTFNREKYKNDTELVRNFYAKNIVHGLGNILSGVIEAIPYVGSVFIFHIRRKKEKSISKNDYIDFNSKYLQKGPIYMCSKGDFLYHDEEEIKAIKKYKLDSYEDMRRIGSDLLNPKTKFLSYFTVEEMKDLIDKMPVFDKETEEAFDYYVWCEKYKKYPVKIDKKD